MLLLHKKKHGIHIYTVWFAKEPLKKSGIISYREYMGKKVEPHAVKFETLISDLRQTEEEIKQKFSKNCRYYVNRAARENIQVEFFSGTEVADDMIEEFIEFFETFWESKGMPLKEKDKLERELKLYRDMEALGITVAVVNGEKAVYHTHILTDNMVRLLHSASLFRFQKEDAVNKNLIGIANRFLHYEEMKYYKNSGKTIYDWGGAGMDEDVVHITEFKKSFGGEPVTYYDFEQVKGPAARLFKLAVKLLRK